MSMTKPDPGEQVILPLIVTARGLRVILDGDLAKIYGVETRILNQAVKRNRDRFPHEFVFKLTAEEAAAAVVLRSKNAILKPGQEPAQPDLSGQEPASLRSQIVISKGGRGGAGIAQALSPSTALLWSRRY